MKVNRYILVASLLANVVMGSYMVHRVYLKFRSATIKNEIKQLEYFVGRDQVFRSMPNDSAEIIFLGNSLTHNFELAELFKDLAIKNRGINGDITLGVLKRLDEVTESSPKKIFIEVGINDILQSVPMDSIQANYVKVISFIKEKSPSTEIYVQGLLPTSWNIYRTDIRATKKVIELNEFLSELCEQHTLTFIDLYDHFAIDDQLNPKYDCGDGLHLSGEGYLHWKDMIRTFVES